MWLSNDARERLRAWRIPPWDKTDAELAEQSRARRNANRRAKRRAAGAKPRSIYLLKSKSHKKPWEALGISRATYYRQGYHRETGVALGQENTKQSRSRPQSHLRETSAVTAKKILEGPYLSHSSLESQMKGNSH